MLTSQLNRLPGRNWLSAWSVLLASALQINFRFAHHPPTISKHYATIVTNLAVHIRPGL